MRITISDEARRFVAERGATQSVRPIRHRCCSGPLTTLEVALGDAHEERRA